MIGELSPSLPCSLLFCGNLSLSMSTTSWDGMLLGWLMMCLPEAEGSSMALMCARATSLTSQTLAGSSSVLPSNIDCSKLKQVFDVILHREPCTQFGGSQQFGGLLVTEPAAVLQSQNTYGDVTTELVMCSSQHDY